MNTYNVKTAESVNLHFVAISEVPITIRQRHTSLKNGRLYVVVVVSGIHFFDCNLCNKKVVKNKNITIRFVMDVS